ncbi:MAG: hypothetical protein JRJ45_08150 [Deltaproteobacteria bacterium]|nr:hypothetical protein [Deltaproteobacteria bacterium]
MFYLTRGKSKQYSYRITKGIVVILAVFFTITAFTIIQILKTTIFAGTVRNGLAIALIFGILFGSDKWINNSKGVIWAILISFITTIVWVLKLNRPFRIHEIYPTVGIFLLILLIVNFSIKTLTGKVTSNLKGGEKKQSNFK